MAQSSLAQVELTARSKEVLYDQVGHGARSIPHSFHRDHPHAGTRSVPAGRAQMRRLIGASANLLLQYALVLRLGLNLNEIHAKS